MAARRPTRPGRTLGIFFAAIAVLYGLVALAGSWSPALGLDLQGGTRITLIATGDNVTAANLTEAAGIIDQRVNGTGVSEAEVTTQGNRYVIVEIPGQSRRDLVETVKRQAQLRFRVVASQSPGVATTPTEAATPTDGASDGASEEPSEEPTPTTSPGAGVLLPSDTASPSPTASASGNGKNRAPYLLDESESADPTASASSEPSPSASGGGQGGKGDQGGTIDPPIDEPLKWMDSPDEKSVEAYNAFSCGTDTQSANVDPVTGKVTPGDNPDLPLLACDDDGYKYLLSVAMVEGTDLNDASAGIPQNDVNWVVSLEFNGDGTKQFAEISRALYGTDNLFAIVLDGKVISAPTMNGIITNGQAEISGNFNQESAESLATSLRYGALPITFEKDPTVETVGPSLAGDQLSAGLLAGAIGLAAVMLYCLLYYRGLGVVVVASLFVAAAITFGVVLLLDKAANFTLTLPGIAGLIVAVGITADSFIVYFERIRDEMRDGKSMRVAVQSGWLRARNTCLAADAVSLLAAVVLYIFAAGAVKGFAFALGISTIIDLAVFFWFTHPMVTWLSGFRFFNQGHRLSGLDAEALGVDSINVSVPAQTVGQTVGGRV